MACGVFCGLDGEYCGLLQQSQKNFVWETFSPKTTRLKMGDGGLVWGSVRRT